MTIANASNLFGKFLEVKFLILENFIPEMPLMVPHVSDLSNTRVLLFVNNKNATENKRLLEIYAVVNQVTSRPKQKIQMFVSTFCRGLSESNLANF